MSPNLFDHLFVLIVLLLAFPIGGWWAYRRFPPGHELHGCHLRQVHYSLLISLESSTALPIYNEVAQAITTIETAAKLLVDAQ